MNAAAVRVPFNVLRPGDDRADIERAIARVLDSGWFVLGPEVAAFESEFAAAAGAAHAVGVNTGTDAIALALRALGIGPGDEVITAPLSAAYTALAVDMIGARPVFADLDGSRLTLDPAAAAAAVTPRTRAIVPVHLYGQPADMEGIAAVAARHHLAVVEDACQAHGATADGRPVGRGSAAAAFSFYPTKNLGALGDGGAITTDDQLLAARYRDALGQAPVLVPREHDAGHVYHLFPVLSGNRDAFQAHLRAAGVETLIHYPVPIPRQPAARAWDPAPCPIADDVCGRVLSLPLYPSLAPAAQNEVIAAVLAFPR